MRVQPCWRYPCVYSVHACTTVLALSMRVLCTCVYNRVGVIHACTLYYIVPRISTWLCSIKVVVIAPISVCFSVTATYLCSYFFKHLCVPLLLPCMLKSTALRVAVQTLYNNDWTEKSMTNYCNYRFHRRFRGGRQWWRSQAGLCNFLKLLIRIKFLIVVFT